MNKLYVMRTDTKAFMEEVGSLKEGRELIEFYEEDDKKDGDYKKGLYDVVDGDRNSIIS